MPSNIATVAELDRRLDAARESVRRVLEAEPGLEVMAEIGAQLERLRAGTPRGERPPRALRDALDFGQLTSRHAHRMEPALANELLELASWVVYA